MLDPMDRARRRSDERKAKNAAARERAQQPRPASEAVEQPIPRRKTGLKWLLDKGRINVADYLTGEEIGVILARGAQAEQPQLSPADGTAISRRAPQGIADWRIDAITERRTLTRGIDHALGDSSVAVLMVLSQVCWHGRTARDVGQTDAETARVETLLKIGIDTARNVLDKSRRFQHGREHDSDRALMAAE